MFALKGKHLKTRLRESLDEDDFTKFIECEVNSRCGSLFCSDCQKVAWSLASKRYSRHLTKSNMANIKRSGNHITGVVGVTDSTNINGALELLKKDRNKLNFISKKMKGMFGFYRFFEICYEIEIVDVDLLYSTGCTYKQSNVYDLTEEYGLQGCRYLFFIHWHGITNLTKDEVRRLFGKSYLRKGESLAKTDPDCGLYIQSFHQDKHLVDSFSVMSRYPLKTQTNYKLSYLGHDEGTIPIDSEQLKNLYEMYVEMSGRNFSSLFVSGKSQEEYLNPESDLSWALTEGLRAKIKERS